MSDPDETQQNSPADNQALFAYQLAEVTDAMKALTKEMNQHRTELALLKFKSSLWGGGSGLGSSVLINLLLRTKALARPVAWIWSIFG